LLEPKRSASNSAEGRDRPWAIEIKRSLTPKLEKGFYLACEDIDPARRILVYPRTETFPLKESVEARPLKSAAQVPLDLRHVKDAAAAGAQEPRSILTAQ
jgi:hypothetical protein